MRKMAKLSMLMSLSGLLLSLTVLTGCGTNAPRVALIPSAIWADGKPETAVRIGHDVKVRVYVKDGEEWILSDNEVTVPEGWYAIAPPPAKKEK